MSLRIMFGFFFYVLLVKTFRNLPPTLDLLPVVSENVSIIHAVVHASNLGARLCIHHEVLSVSLLRPLCKVSVYHCVHF